MKNENEFFSLNDFASSKAKKGESLFKNKLVIGIIAALFLILIIIIIILIIRKNSNSKSQKSEDEIIEEKKIGEINCILDVKDISKEINLLNDDFEKKSDFDIRINKKKNKIYKKV